MTPLENRDQVVQLWQAGLLKVSEETAIALYSIAEIIGDAEFFMRPEAGELGFENPDHWVMVVDGVRGFFHDRDLDVSKARLLAASWRKHNELRSSPASRRKMIKDDLDEAIAPGKRRAAKERAVAKAREAGQLGVDDLF